MRDTVPVSAIVLFSGPGGVCEGLRNAGVTNLLGVEFEANAVATAKAAGHAALLADVRTLDPRTVRSELIRQWLLMQASPPCQGLSPAGKGEGRKDVEKLLTALEQLSLLDIAAAKRVTGWWCEQLAKTCSDERSPLTFEVIRWIADLEPEFVMLEQVPTALPIWQGIAKVLEAWGYSVWTGNVQAEQFGVPQTRKRAKLIASCVSEVGAPAPTHSKYYPRDPSRLDEGVPTWVSMAEAMGWGLTHRPAYTVTGGGTETGGAEPFANGARKGMAACREAGEWIDIPDSLRMTTMPNSAQRTIHQPAPTMAFGHDAASCQWHWHEPTPAIEGETVDDLDWVYTRPAPTMVGSFAPDVVAKPGFLKPGDPPRQKTPGSVRITAEEAGILQSFPVEYPWQGAKGKVFQQVGNAVPPLLQQALTEQLLATAMASTLYVAA